MIDPTVILTMFAAAVAALFAAMVKERNDRLAEKDRQLAELKSEIVSLRLRTDTFDQILVRNTDALSQSADSMNLLVGAIRQGKIGVTTHETLNSTNDLPALPQG